MDQVTENIFTRLGLSVAATSTKNGLVLYTLKTQNASFDCIRQVCLDIWTVLRAKSIDVALTLSSNVVNVATLSGMFC